MRIRLPGLVVPALSICTAACGGDATGTSALVTLCPQADWAAMQVEEQPWHAIPVTRAQYPLGVAKRIGLARIRTTPDVTDSLQIYYVTPEQAAATFSCDPRPPGASPAKQLHGTIQGDGTPLTDPAEFGYPSRATVTLGLKQTFVGGSTGNDITLADIPSGTRDLVATALDVRHSTIIRRGVDYPDNSTIPALDFSSSEAFGLTENTVTIAGNSNNYDWQAGTRVITQRGTLGLLRYRFMRAASTTSAISSVPENQLLAGELNSLTVGFGSSITTVYYRVPSDRSVEIGPEANRPTLTRSGTLPDLALLIEEISQPEYGSQIVLGLSPPLNATINLKPIITASKEYFGGTPTTWSFTIPDFQGIGNFPSSYGDLRSSGVQGMEVTDRPYLASPRDGATYRSAFR